MHPATVQFHQTAIRLAKGLLAAYESWFTAVSGVTVQRGAQDWLKQAEIIAAAQVITNAFQARQAREQSTATTEVAPS